MITSIKTKQIKQKHPDLGGGGAGNGGENVPMPLAPPQDKEKQTKN